ncbi:hypothetical protein BDQ12DRAFT_683148 [Crucibulum laeve]|uniref:G-protein coupled receptors family 1 profile domain-containing protein n=1 Tax=Crucibulum laeve TaxID=68775 RepID=A0A5C3M0C6_9AGAR|nr:hypothetical protein BDQ12DRAFT_683148 [Crucibulum laeve]
MSVASALPNPLTPLAFLPPTLANQFEVSRYMYAITLGIYLWDIALNLGNDYKLLFQHKILLPTVIYYLSRAVTLAYILTSFIFQVGHVDDCQALVVSLGICNLLSTSGTAMLFLMRIQAIYHRNKGVRMIFIFLWVAVTAGSIVVPVGVSGAHIGPTQQCINTRVASYTEVSAILPMINDTAIFLAISYKILSVSMGDESLKNRARTFFGRGSLPLVSRLLLQSGQQYYLIAACGNIVLLVLVKYPNLPDVYRGMCTIPVLALNNLMACIVFRKIKFGLITHDGAPAANSDLKASFQHSSGGGTLPSHRLQLRRDDPVSSYTFGSSHNNGTQVAVTKTYESDGVIPLDVIVKDSRGYAHDSGSQDSSMKHGQKI